MKSPDSALPNPRFCTCCGRALVDPTGYPVHIGVQVPGVFDGVLYYMCQHCGFAFPRDFGPYKHRQQLSEEHAQRANDQLVKR